MFDKNVLPEKVLNSKHFIACGGGDDGKKPVQEWKKPSLWNTFDDAIQRALDKNFIGFVFPSNSSIICLDFDHVIVNEKPIPEFEELYNFLLNGEVKTYIEFSKSGTGLHVLLENVTEPIVLPDSSQQYYLENGKEKCPFWTETFGYKASLKYALLTGNTVSDAHKNVLASGADADILLRVVEAWACQYLQKDLKIVYENQQVSVQCELPDSVDVSALDPRMLTILKTQYGRVAMSLKGSSNIVLNSAALILGHYCPRYIAQSTIEIALEHAAEVCGLNTRDGLEATHKTITSGLKKGMSEPQKMHGKQSEGMTLQEYAAMPVEDYEEPIAFDFDAVPEIEREYMPPILADVVEELAQKLEVPPSMVFVYAIAVVATVSQRVAKIKGNDSYIMPLCLFVLALAKASNKKSAIYRLLVKGLTAIEEKVNADTAEQRIKNNELRKTLEEALIEISKAKNKELAQVAKDKNPIDTTAKTIEINKKYMEKAKNIKNEMPLYMGELKFFINGDATAEGLFLLSKKMNGYLGLFDHEGKIMELVAGYYTDGKVDTDFYTKSYDGDAVTRLRAGEFKENGDVLTIEASYLTMALTVQPTIFADMSPTTRKKIRERGLFGRFLIAFPRTLEGYRKNLDLPVDEGKLLPFNRALERIFALEPDKDLCGNEHKKVLVLSDDAKVLVRRYLQGVEEMLRPFGKLSELTDWAGKLYGHLHRLAGLFHFLSDDFQEKGSLVVSAHTVEMATCCLIVLSGHAAKFFGVLDCPRNVQLATRALQWLKLEEKTTFSQREMYQRFKSSCPEMKDLLPVIDLLTERAYIFPIKSELSGRQGRPKSPAFFVNPKGMRGENVNA